MKILITSGGTKIAIDRVRHIANMSSGTFGSKIAKEALERNHYVTFFHAEKSKTPFTINVNLFNMPSNWSLAEKVVDISNDFNRNKYLYSEKTYTTFDTYMSGLEGLVTQGGFDIVILAAAVSDYGVDNYVDGKIRSKDSDMTIRLKALPKIISMVKKWAPTTFLVGFKLLVDSTDDELIANAQKSVADNGCDMVVANDLRDIKNNAHRLIIVKPNEEPKMYRSDFNNLAKVVIMEATRKGNQ